MENTIENNIFIFDEEIKTVITYETYRDYDFITKIKINDSVIFETEISNYYNNINNHFNFNIEEPYLKKVFFNKFEKLLLDSLGRITNYTNYTVDTEVSLLNNVRYYDFFYNLYYSKTKQFLRLAFDDGDIFYKHHRDDLDRMFISAVLDQYIQLVFKIVKIAYLKEGIDFFFEEMFVSYFNKNMNETELLAIRDQHYMAKQLKNF